MLELDFDSKLVLQILYDFSKGVLFIGDECYGGSGLRMSPNHGEHDGGRNRKTDNAVTRCSLSSAPVLF